MAKILFVDDEPDIELLTQQKYRKQVAEGVFELFYALNGQEALEIIKHTPDIKVIITDINMPHMDGLVLLDKVKEVNPGIKTIVLSAYGDTKTLRSAMNKGAYDFVTKPINFTELGDLIEETLAHCKDSHPPLFTYQLVLASAFPQRVDLNSPHQKAFVLWDAFDFDKEHLLSFGISVLPSLFPIELATTAAHSLLRSLLDENPELSLKDFEKKLSCINPALKAYALISQYHKKTHAFSFRTNGEFKATHISGEEKVDLDPSQTALLNLGDVIHLEHTFSGSSLSLSCIEES